MKLQPAKDCCGWELIHGVETICLFTIIICISIMCLAKTDPTKIAGKGEIAELGLVEWAIIGIPFAIIGGVAVLYRMESALRAFQYYLCGSVVVALFLAPGISTPISGLGSKLYTVALLPILLHSIYIVWSSCEEIADCSYPKLMQTADALRYAYSPEVQGVDANGRAYSLTAEAAANGGAPPVPVVPIVPPTRMMWMNNESFRQGTPQSFIPEPASAFMPVSPTSFMPGPGPVAHLPAQPGVY